MPNPTSNTKRTRHHDYEAEAQRVINGDPRPTLCTANAAAIVLDVTGKHVRTLLANGSLKGYQLGRAWRVNVQALLDLAGIV